MAAGCKLRSRITGLVFPQTFSNRYSIPSSPPNRLEKAQGWECRSAIKLSRKNITVNWSASLLLVRERSLWFKFPCANKSAKLFRAKYQPLLNHLTKCLSHIVLDAETEFSNPHTSFKPWRRVKNPIAVGARSFLTYKLLITKSKPVILYHVRSINHNILVGAGFEMGDCGQVLLANPPLQKSRSLDRTWY